MDRDRVMRLRVDPGVVEEFQKCVALSGLLRLNDVKMEDVPVTGQFDREVKMAAVLESGGVARRPLPSQVIPRVDVLEFGAEDAGLQIVEAAVETEAMNVARVRAVIAKLADALVDLRIVRHQRAAVAEAAKVFLNDEAGRHGVA